MDKDDRDLKRTILRKLNDIAKEYGWHVDLTKSGIFRIKNSQNAVVYSSSYPTDIAFYMGGNNVC